MTSNIGSAKIGKIAAIGFKAAPKEQRAFEEIKEAVLKELTKTLRPEFLNRVDEIIVFHPLSKEQIKQIVDIMMIRVKKELKAQGIDIELTEAAKDLLAEKGYDPNLGARPLRRTIQHLVENPLSSKILRGEFVSGDSIIADASEGKLVFKKKKREIDDKKEAAS
jgi:ATP-dependent Clp protease ATP-binding subunit ClpC